MIFLPIVERELRVAARRRATHWVRAGFAFGTIFIGVLVYLSNLNSTARGFANNLFGALAFLSLFYCLVSGVRLTADWPERGKAGRHTRAAFSDRFEGLRRDIRQTGGHLAVGVLWFAGHFPDNWRSRCCWAG